MAKWQFHDPPNVAVIANRKIVREGDWIAYVSHDADDGSWQFHNSETSLVKESDAIVVSLRNIVQIDPTVNDLAELPLGWCAWRNSKNSAWYRARIRITK